MLLWLFSDHISLIHTRQQDVRSFGRLHSCSPGVLSSSSLPSFLQGAPFPEPRVFAVLGLRPRLMQRVIPEEFPEKGVWDKYFEESMSLSHPRVYLRLGIEF